MKVIKVALPPTPATVPPEVPVTLPEPPKALPAEESVKLPAAAVTSFVAAVTNAAAAEARPHAALLQTNDVVSSALKTGDRFSASAAGTVTGAVEKASSLEKPKEEQTDQMSFWQKVRAKFGDAKEVSGPAPSQSPKSVE